MLITHRNYDARKFLSCYLVLLFMFSFLCSCSGDSAHEGGLTPPELKIVKDGLWGTDYFFVVRGSIYNPHERGVQNVTIKYYIWEKWIGQDGHGSLIKTTGGLVMAKINYLPPKQTVEFETVGNNAPVMTRESGLTPDPIVAKISAEWAE